MMNMKYKTGKRLSFFILGSLLLSITALICLTRYYETLDALFEGMLPSTYVVVVLFVWQHTGLTWCVGNKCLGSPSIFFRSMFYWLAATVLIHFIAILFGAPFLGAVKETFHFAMLVSVTAVLPGLCILGTSNKQWTQVFVQHIVNDGSQILCHSVGIASALGAWFGAFPIPLDWDRPWQRWPRSCLIGCLAGYTFGLIVSLLRIRYHKPGFLKDH